jgi:hypothetical protein
VDLAAKAPGNLVFTTSEGGVLRNTNFRPRFFDPAAEKAGLPELTPHELRHTTASHAVAAGANVKAVQQMLGHASAAMTLDVYAGLFADDLDGVADQLDRAFTKLNADQMRTKCGPQGAQARPIRACCRSRIRPNKPLARPNDLEPSWGIEPPRPTHYERVPTVLASDG